MVDFIYDVKFISGITILLGYFIIRLYYDLKDLRSDMQYLRKRIFELENK